MRGIRFIAVVMAGLCLAGCATTPPTPEMLANNDPYEPMNRNTLALNGKIDRYFVIPTVGVYFLLVGDGGRRAVHNFLQNLSAPTVFVNDVLQGETRRASQTLGRFVINSTIGFAGFLDPASKQFHIPFHGEDFGQTLAVYGVPEGPYLIAPFFGPQPPRDGAGLLIDALVLDPTNYVPISSISGGGPVVTTSRCWICAGRPIRPSRESSAGRWTTTRHCAAFTGSCVTTRFATDARTRRIYRTSNPRSGLRHELATSGSDDAGT